MESMEPNPVWDAETNAEVVDAFASLSDDAVVKVWGADWCPDTRNQLPDFAAALAAAGIEDDQIDQIAVDRNKEGEGTEEYGIEFIPSIVVEDDGEEIARFVEEEDVPAAVYLAGQFADLDMTFT